jgi:hypothetical protein
MAGEELPLKVREAKVIEQQAAALRVHLPVRAVEPGLAAAVARGRFQEGEPACLCGPYRAPEHSSPLPRQSGAEAK